MMAEEPLHFFQLECWTDDERDGCLDLDDFQIVFDVHNGQVRINLTGEQVEMIKNWPSVLSRLAGAR